MAERLFYCGVDPPEHVAEHATQLWLTGDRKNIKRDIESVADVMVADVPARLQDLLDIATYVFVADRITSRGETTFPNMGATWYRKLRFVIAVRDPVFWNRPDRVDALEELIGFLSDDLYELKFVRSAELPQFPKKLPMMPRQRETSRKDQVILFSGGLDSLAGAVEELHDSGDRVVLVSHRSSNNMAHCQKELVDLTCAPTSIQSE